MFLDSSNCPWLYLITRRVVKWEVQSGFRMVLKALNVKAKAGNKAIAGHEMNAARKHDPRL